MAMPQQAFPAVRGQGALWEGPGQYFATGRGGRWRQTSVSWDARPRVAGTPCPASTPGHQGLLVLQREARQLLLAAERWLLRLGHFLLPCFWSLDLPPRHGHEHRLRMAGAGAHKQEAPREPRACAASPAAPAAWLSTTCASCETETFGHARSLQFALAAPLTPTGPQHRFCCSSLCYSSPARQVTDQSDLMLSPEGLIPFLCPDPQLTPYQQV